jgi:glycosyltransferase involved in cell wall biosynthesis
VRILFVIPSLGSGGGAERSLIESVPQLRERGIDVSIAQFFRRPHERQEGALHEKGARIHDIAAPGVVLRVVALRRIVDTECPDIVHTTLFDADIAGRAAVRLARRASPRLLTSLVNTSYDAARSNDPRVRAWKLRAVRQLDGLTARHMTDHFHAITRAVKEDAIRSLRIAPHRITVIERGRDPARLGTWSQERRSRARAKLGLDSSADVIVTVGRQEFQKGQTHLVAAFERVAATHPNAVLLLAGRRGHESDAIDATIARSPARGQIRLLGHRDDLPDVLAASDVFAFPSIYEGLGGAVIEAMALGLPVVASDLPAVREVVEDGGSALLAPPADPPALAATIATLIDDSEMRHRLGTRGREIFDARFTLDRSTERMVELYSEVLTPSA